MRQQGEIVRIIEEALHDRGYVVSNHDEGDDRVVVAEHVEKGLVNRIAVRPDAEIQKK